MLRGAGGAVVHEFSCYSLAFCSVLMGWWIRWNSGRKNHTLEFCTDVSRLLKRSGLPKGMDLIGGVLGEQAGWRGRGKRGMGEWLQIAKALLHHEEALIQFGVRNIIDGP